MRGAPFLVITLLSLLSGCEPSNHCADPGGVTWRFAGDGVSVEPQEDSCGMTETALVQAEAAGRLLVSNEFAPRPARSVLLDVTVRSRCALSFVLRLGTSERRTELPASLPGTAQHRADVPGGPLAAAVEVRAAETCLYGIWVVLRDPAP